jgi:anti-anti-sigma regulatory factor
VIFTCTCLGALTRAHRVAGRTGRTLALAAPRPLVRRTLALTKVDTVLPVFPDSAAAVCRLAPVARAA